MTNDLFLDCPTPSDDRPLTVSEITHQIRDLLEDGFSEIAVTGEISNLRSPGSGHLYFTLKDDSAVLQAVMFRSDAARAGFKPADGQAVVAHGRITLYEPRGQYQLQVRQLQPAGQGTLQQQFEALKRKLAAEGLFETSRKRPLPVFPETVGIVTSLQGAVLQDILRILKRRAPGIRIHVRGVRVQGSGAAREIADAIRAFNDDACTDVLIIARGGGSIEDLWEFNEETVARAIAASAIPTVSAVGHETDFTIADFVADMRAPTPSAAAELISRDWSEWREEIRALNDRLRRATQHGLELRREHLLRLRDSHVFREPARLIRQWQQKLDDHADRLAAGLRHAAAEHRHRYEKILLQLQRHHPAQAVRHAREQLRQWEARLRTLGPHNTLARGYAMVTDDQGRVVRKPDPKLVGKTVNIALAKGNLSAKVEGASRPS